MPSPLPESLQHPLLWQGAHRRHASPTVPTGHSSLDKQLPGGGWPLGALTELLIAREGLGELSLLLPTLASVASQGGWMVLVDPPWTPYPPAIHGQGVDLQRLLVINTRNADESLWACEQSLRGLRGGLVMSWLQGGRHSASFVHLRRLQLAARSGHKTAFLFRPAEASGQASPAALRLHINADEQDLHVTVLKCRGNAYGNKLTLRRPLPYPIAAVHKAGPANPLSTPGSREFQRTNNAPDPKVPAADSALLSPETHVISTPVVKH